MQMKFQSIRAKVADFIKPSSKNIKAVGTTGTNIFSGFFDEETLSKLVAEQGIAIFDRMRRSDGQVKMLLSVFKNPIKAAKWGIEAVDDSDKEKEIADFVEHVLFNDMGYSDGSKVKTFSEFIGEALTMAEFGFSCFEIIHKNVENHPTFGNYLGIADLAYRHPRSILQWHLNKNGSIKNVRQLVTSGDLNVDVLIDGRFLLVFTMEKEGDNYQGISMLRPIYGNWFRKDVYRKLQAIGIERTSKGVPIGKMPIEALNADDYDKHVADFQDVLDKLASHQTNGVVLGAGLELTELKLSHDPVKVQKVITSENVEMTKAFLANFMELGLENNSGSFALGSDLSDIFLSGLLCYAKIIEERVDICVIKDIVRAKFGDRTAYPKLKARGINDKAGVELAEVLEKLFSIGGIQVSDAVKDHLHDLYGLPGFDPELEKEIEEDDDNDDNESDSEPEKEPNLSDKTCDHKHSCDCGARFESAYVDLKKNVLSKAGLSDGEHLSKLEQDRLDALFYKEAAKDVLLASAIPSVFITRQAEPLEKAIRQMLTERSDKMIDKMVKIFDTEKNEDKARRLGLAQRLPNKKAFQDMVKASAGDTSNKALDAVLKEMNATRSTFNLQDEISDLPRKMQKAVLAEAFLTAEFLDLDLEKIVLFGYNLNISQTDSPAQLRQEIKRTTDKFLTGRIPKTAATNMTSKITNGVRNDFFQVPEVLDEIESFIFVNPAPVSAICQNLTGKVFSKEEYATTAFLPPLHHNCWLQGTEIYTQNGWKLFEDVDIEEDVFLSLNPENFDLEYVEAHRYIASPFKGEMYHFTNSQGSVSQCVTPDHPMVYMKRVDHGKAGRVKEWTESDIKTFIAHGSEAAIYCTSEWKGISKDIIEANGKEYPIEPFLKMMGYYLSEGSRSGNFIIISQFHKENLATIKKDMESFNFNVWKSGIAFKDASLYEWLSQFGKSHQKFVPEIIKELAPEHLRVFLDAFCLGDGCTYKDRPCFTGKTTYRMFGTASHRMAGDLTELLIKIGRSASMRIVTPKGTETEHKNGTYTSNHDVWGVFDLSSKTRRVTKIEKIDYDGFVYDVSLVKNYTLLIKHNGCISWGSNCKSTIRAQRTKARNKKPVDEAGLVPTGTDTQIEKALKSITI